MSTLLRSLTLVTVGGGAGTLLVLSAVEGASTGATILAVLVGVSIGIMFAEATR